MARLNDFLFSVSLPTQFATAQLFLTSWLELLIDGEDVASAAADAALGWQDRFLALSAQNNAFLRDSSGNTIQHMFTNWKTSSQQAKNVTAFRFRLTCRESSPATYSTRATGRVAS